MNPSQPMTTPRPPPQGPDPEPSNEENPAQEKPTTLEDPESFTVTQWLIRVLSQRGKLPSIQARVFMWIVQAGFIILPSSFPSIEGELLDSCEYIVIVQRTRNIEFFSLGIVCCVVGSIGLLYLGLRHSGRDEHDEHDWHDWLLNSIFIPGTFSGLSGIIAAFVFMYSWGHDIYYGATTISTLVVTGGCTVICGSLTVIYMVLKTPTTSP